MKQKIYNRQTWELVNLTNKKLLKMYMRSLVTNRRRPRTIEQYEHDLKFFLTWNFLYNLNMCVMDFKKRHFDDFKFFMLEERGVSNARVNRIMSAIRQMMSYAEDDDDEFEDYVRNVAAKVKGLQKNPVKEITFLTEQQVVLLREHLREHEMYKHMFLLDLLYDSGARVSEAYQAKNLSTDSPCNYLKVECKGGKHEYILLHERSQESLKLYIEQLDGKPIWTTRSGGVAKDDNALRFWVGEMQVILSQLDPTAPYFTPHSFRHTFLQNATDGSHYLCEKIGRPFTMEEAQLLAHHQSIDMTKSYLKPKDNEMIFNLFGIAVA